MSATLTHKIWICSFRINLKNTNNFAQSVCRSKALLLHFYNTVATVNRLDKHTFQMFFGGNFLLIYLILHIICAQEVIGKSVKQAVFLPLYTVPERYDLVSLYIYIFKYSSIIVIKVVFIWSCPLSFQLWKHSTTFWTSVFVRKTQTSWFAQRVTGVCVNVICFLRYRWNDKKAKMHYVLFCMPEVSPSKLYLLRKGTDQNRFVWLFVYVWLSLCV